MSDKAPKDQGQKTAEAEVEEFKKELGPFVVAAEMTRMPMAFTDSSKADNPIIFANDAFLELTGYNRDEVLAQSFNFLLAAGTDEETVREVEAAFADPSREEPEIHYRRKDGSECWATLFVAPVRDEQGAVAQYFLSLIDTTHYKAAEQDAKLVKAATDYAIFMTDPSGRIVTWNTGAERIKGYTADEAIGQNFCVFYTDEERAAGRPARALRIAATHSRYEEEGWRLRKNGTLMSAHVVIDPVCDDSGELIGFANIIQDVTEKRNIERQLIQAQKMEAVGQLAGGMAHDFNNILSVVIGNLDLLVEEVAEDSEQNTLAAEALSAAEKGAELVRNLLAFSRNQTLELKSLDVREVVNSMEPLLRRAVGESVAIEFKLEEESYFAFADRSQLESAIMNLAINARDAMPTGGRLSIRCSNIILDEHLARQEDVPVGDYVVLSFSDTGTGMKPDVLARAFDPFFTTKEVGKGSGLGLSMVYGFTHQVGGTTKVQSEPGHGTEVQLYLPGAQPESEVKLAEASMAADTRDGKCILIVEDSDDVRKAAVRAATSLGYEVIVADSAEAALELVKDGSDFDILFTDVVLPGSMNGLDLAWDLRMRRPDLPIVLTSGFLDPKVIATDFGALQATLLPKPYRKSDLSQVLRRALGYP